MSDHALLSLAILKVNWDRLGHDYVECFVPFVVEALRQAPDDAISLEQLQQSLREIFGIDIPLNGLRLVLNRARRHGYVRKDHGILYRDPDKCQELQFQEHVHAVEDAQERVSTALIHYLSTHHATTWTAEDVAHALYQFLHNNSLRLISIATNGGRYEASQHQTHTDYLVGSFVVHCQEQNSRLLDDILMLLQGSLLSNVLHLDDPGRLQQRFQNTTVYLDTSILVFAAGFAGAPRAAPMLELLELLAKYGASIACFQGTYDEIHGILDACAARLRTGNLQSSYGPSMEYFIESGHTASDVEFMQAHLATTIRDLGVSVKELPDYEQRFVIDESSFDMHLEREIGYSNPKARKHDVDSISAIVRLRKGRHSSSIETSRALFVTNNVALAKCTATFFTDALSPSSAPLCVTDYALGNLLWLKSPTAAPNLPTKTLLAHAYAAIRPPDNLWRRYLDEAYRLKNSGEITEDDYHLLRYSIASKNALMTVTHGETQAFTEGTISEVLEVAKERVRSDLRERVAEERSARDKVETELSAQKVREAQRRQRLVSRAAFIAHRARQALSVVIFFALIGGIVITFPYELPSLQYAYNAYLTFGTLSVVLVLTLSNLMWGTTVASLMDALETKLTNYLSNQFLRFAGFL